MFDSYNRKINYLRVSVTDRCNLRCTYCMPEAGIRLKRHDDILPYEKIVQVAAAAASELGIRKVRLTGGEPLVRKNIAFLVRELKALPGIRGSEPDQQRHAAGRFWPRNSSRPGSTASTSRWTRSIPATYRQVTRNGDIARVMAGIAAARRAGFTDIKINMVLLPGLQRPTRWRPWRDSAGGTACGCSASTITACTT